MYLMEAFAERLNLASGNHGSTDVAARNRTDDGLDYRSVFKFAGFLCDLRFQLRACGILSHV
jgi:hypothetical protein